MNTGGVRSVALMGTIITVEVVGSQKPKDGTRDPLAAIEHAFDWFRRIEETCNRFDPRSELCRLSAQPGKPVPVSGPLFEALSFALAVAEESDGAFDPTLGRDLEALGFNRDYRTGTTVGQPADERNVGARASGVREPRLNREAAGTWRDVRLDAANRTVTLRRPMLLDLGAVAKGMAVDLAARELQPWGDFAIDAGGDLFLGGRNREGLPWSVGIRHPREPGQLFCTVQASNRAVCTSGDYERTGRTPAQGHHLLDPRTRRSAATAASATVLAPSAMVADALATAAFVLGPADGIALLERHDVEGMIVTSELESIATKGFRCS